MSQIHLHHDAEHATGFGFAVAVANTWDIWFDDPEKLQTTDELDRFLAGQGWEALAPTREADLDAVRQLRSELRSVFASQSAREAAAMLAALFGPLTVVPKLMVDQPSEADVAVGFGPRPGAVLPEQMRVIAGLGLAGALERWGIERLRMCDADRCQDVFVDVSKNGRRRYCGVKCQNRINVAALRHRTAQARQGHD